MRQKHSILGNKILFISLLTALLFYADMFLCIQSIASEPTRNYSVSIKDLALTEEEAIDKAKSFLIENKYTKYYIVTSPRTIKELNNKWLLSYKCKEDTNNIDFDLQVIVDTTSVEAKINKLRVNVTSSWLRNGMLSGKDMIVDGVICKDYDSPEGYVLQLSFYDEDYFAAIIPYSSLPEFFAKCGDSKDHIADYYIGRYVQVKGILEGTDEKPKIITKLPGQIVLVPMSKLEPLLPDEGTHSRVEMRGAF